MVQKQIVSSEKTNKDNGIKSGKVKFMPQLRFSGFDNAEWIEVKLKDISDRVTRKNKDLETNRPLTISAQYGLVDQEEYFNKTVASKNLEGYYLLNKGEFAYNKSYSNGYPYGAIKRLDNYENGAISTLYICFKPKENINSDFLKEYFETSNWYKEMYKIAVEGARNHGLLNIPVNDFFETKHKIPKSIEEQKKIGEFFKIINKKIELLENKANNLILEKDYYLNNIMSKRIKSNLMFDKWQMHYLKDIAFVPKKKKLKKLKDEKLLTVKLHTKGVCINENIKPKITERGRPYYKRYSDELLIGRQNFHNGGIGIVPMDLNGGICSNAISSFCVYEDKITLKFLYYYLSRKNYYKSSEKFIGGTGQKEFSEKQLMKLKIEVPPLDEQMRITNFLDKLMQKSELNEKKLTLYKKYKNGLLQKMFV